MSLKIKTWQRNGTDVVKLSGDLSGQDVVKINRSLLSMDVPPAGTVVIDLSEASFIDSHGLGVLVYVWKQLESQGKQMVFVAPEGGFVSDMLNSTNLSRMIRTVASLEEL